MVLQEIIYNIDISFWSRVCCYESCNGSHAWFKVQTSYDGVPLSGPTYKYRDSMSVIHHTQRSDLVLRKKSNSMCYHAIRKYMAMEELPTAYIRTAKNSADLCTKVIPGGQKRDHLVSKLLFVLTD